jgi:NAD(P)H-hydrate repair Nnr-like enzyme with NAD(P)H-hydrate dehydratase domain
LIVAGSEKYHGSLFYALKSASRVLGLIYVLSTKENLRLVSKLKSQTASFIPVAKIDEVIVDAVLIGPGMGISPRTRRLVKQVLESGQKAVLDADALSILDEKLKEKLNPNNILTPHHGEFERVFNLKPKKKLIIVKSETKSVRPIVRRGWLIIMVLTGEIIPKIIKNKMKVERAGLKRFNWRPGYVLPKGRANNSGTITIQTRVWLI